MAIPSLADFAKQEPSTSRRRCITCELPPAVREQVDAAMREGSIAVATIHRFLQKQCGFTGTSAAVLNHRRSGHHER